MDPTLLQRYTSFLQLVLTPHRLQHSLGVMQVMGEIAEVYGLERERALVTGLLHDAGKDLPQDVQQRIIEQAAIEIHNPHDQNYLLYLHGPVGAYFVNQKLGITDALILDAISMHTFYGGGKNFNSRLVWCLRFSDVLEPNRRWNNVPQIREGRASLRKLVYGGRMEEAAFLHTGLLIEMFEEQGLPVHPNLRHVHREFSGRPGFDKASMELSE